MVRTAGQVARERLLPACRPMQGETVPAGTLAVLGPGRTLRARATSRLVAAARPLHEPIVRRGPFVMNTEAELQQAFEDHRNGVLDRAQRALGRSPG